MFSVSVSAAFARASLALVIALNGDNYPVPLNLSSLAMPGNWVF